MIFVIIILIFDISAPLKMLLSIYEIQLNEIKPVSTKQVFYYFQNNIDYCTVNNISVLCDFLACPDIDICMMKMNG